MTVARGTLLCGVIAGLLLALPVLAGCGGDSDGTTRASTATTQPEETTTPSPPSEHARAGGKERRAHAAQKTGASGDAGGSRRSSDKSPKPPHYAPDRSLQTFGSSAAGGQREEIVAFVKDYLRALTRHDYTAVCAVERAETRERVDVYLQAKHEEGGCPKAVAPFVDPLAKPAADALAGTFTGVRVKGRDAVVFLRPRGGKPSWFTVTREGGHWRIISLTVGTPVDALP